jgi:anthranilate synthase component 1
MFGYESPTGLDQPKNVSQLNFRKLPFACSPADIFQRIYKRYEYLYLLESIEGPKKLAQYSFLGFNPRLIISAKDGEMSLKNKEANEEIKMKVRDPLNVIKKIVSERECPYKPLRFIGGTVGYISYDAIRYWERLPDIAVDDLNFPNVEMGMFDDGVVFDHNKEQVFYYYRDKNRFNDLKNLMEEPADPETLSCSNPKMNVNKEQYEKSVQKAKDYVASGDIFQVVLSKRYEFNVKGNLASFYLALRRINPSPYMYFLKMGDHQIVGSSPEMLVRVDNRIVETFPIAGTRPRVDDAGKNRVLSRELLADPKERAEHVMLVDLARNDIGRVSKFGSVHVPEFMEVHQYSHVQHIVSRVVGTLRNECDCYDALRAVFPAGTVSGAPKVRAMEIIEESEPTKRGPYAGAVGYFSYNRNADFAITIRTLVANGRKGSVQVGAGIVADSVPEREWFETEHKAEALMKALELSGGN